MCKLNEARYETWSSSVKSIHVSCLIHPVLDLRPTQIHCISSHIDGNMDTDLQRSHTLKLTTICGVNATWDGYLWHFEGIVAVCVSVTCFLCQHTTASLTDLNTDDGSVIESLLMLHLLLLQDAGWKTLKNTWTDTTQNTSFPHPPRASSWRVFWRTRQSDEWMQTADPAAQLQFEPTGTSHHNAVNYAANWTLQHKRTRLVKLLPTRSEINTKYWSVISKYV